MNRALVRLNTNGSPDTSFDGDGRVLTDFAASGCCTSSTFDSD